MKQIINKIKMFLDSLRVIKNVNELIIKMHKIQDNNVYLDNRLRTLTSRIDNNFDELDNKIEEEGKLFDYRGSRCLSFEKEITSNIKALEICVNLAKEEYESLKNYHNNLASSFNTYKLDNNPNIMRLFEKINTLNNKVDKHINLTN